MQLIISLIAKTASPLREISPPLLRRIASDLGQWCFIFEHVSKVAGKS